LKPDASKPSACDPDAGVRLLPDSFVDLESVRRGRVRVSKMGKRRAWVLLGVHVALLAHLLHWQLAGRSLSLLEPSEGLYTAARGVVNAGLILLHLSLVATAVFGRFFCGWGCHLIALQDICAWMLKRVGLRPKPLRSRLLAWIPLLAGIYMYFGPVFVRFVRDLRGAPMAEWHLHTEFTKTELWETMPGLWVGLVTLLVAGFAIVYMLGAKGYCTYACPYGGLFGVADRMSPGRIRVTDACKGCGHCTAVCSSNVLVHKEVHEYGMVTDSRCMKCLDCTSVCPEGALYFGFGRPAAMASPRIAHPKPKKAFFSRGEEIWLALLFVLALLVFSGIPRGLVPGIEIETLYGEVPLLLSLALAAITAAVAVTLWRLLRRPEARFQNHLLKQAGRFERGGWAFLLLSCLWLGFVLHSATVQAYTSLGTRIFLATVTAELDAPLWTQNGPALKRLLADRREALTDCRERLETAVALGLFGDSRVQEQLCWLGLLDSDLDRAERHVRAAIAVNPSYPAYRWALYRVLSLQLRRDEALAALKEAVSLRPESETYRFALGQELVARNRLDEALEHLRAVVSLEGPRADEARLFQVGIHARRSATDAMEPLLRQVLLNHPQHLPALGALEQVLRQLGRSREADGIAERIRAAPRDSRDR